jgi:hypothetical protein
VDRVPRSGCPFDIAGLVPLCDNLALVSSACNQSGRISGDRKHQPRHDVCYNAESVLVYPLTESSCDDHSKNALWLGTPVPMRREILRPTYRTELLPGGSLQSA